MFNICLYCGLYSAEKAVDLDSSTAFCPYCGEGYQFVMKMLYVITGASGTGKSTICLQLAKALSGRYIVLETDILWGEVRVKPGDNYASYTNVWLRLAKNIHQSGIGVVLCGSLFPPTVECCPERRYFSRVNYLALTCKNDILRSRLLSRPDWRGSSDEAFINRMLELNGWFLCEAGIGNPQITLLDTSCMNVQQATTRVVDWVLASEVWP